MTTFQVYKEEQMLGPYNEEQLLVLMQEGRVARTDLVFYDGLKEWQPIEHVFDIEEEVQFFIDEGQDEKVVIRVYQMVAPMLGSDEEIYYIAHQPVGLLRRRPDCVVATNQRLLFIRITLTGQSVEDYMWRNVISVQMRQGVRGRKFSIVYGNNYTVEVDGLPRSQISRLYRLSKDMRIPATR